MTEAHLIRQQPRRVPPAVKRTHVPEPRERFAGIRFPDLVAQAYVAGVAGAHNGSTRGAVAGTALASASALVIAVVRGMIPDVATTIAVAAMNVVVFALVGVTLGFALGGLAGALVAGASAARRAWHEQAGMPPPAPRKRLLKDCTEHNGHE